MVDEDLKLFIMEYLPETHDRDDYKELLNLAALLVGLDTGVAIRKPGALHRARCYSHLFNENRATLQR